MSLKVTLGNSVQQVGLGLVQVAPALHSFPSLACPSLGVFRSWIWKFSKAYKQSKTKSNNGS